MNEAFALWPAQASTYAAQSDLLAFLFGLLVALLSLPVFILMIVFSVKYRRGKPADRTHRTNRNIWMEVSWALIPFVLVLGFYIWSTRLFIELRSPPASAININVVAKQWMWKAQHGGGQGELNQLHVPSGEPVKLTLASQDVIHSLYIPALRIKQDVLPGRYATMWFTADRPGIYKMMCAEFCGADHSAMGGELIVLSPADYARWLEQIGSTDSLAAQGATLFRAAGCSGCHGPAATIHAPDLNGLYGRPVPLQDGSVVRADERYIHDSILLPQSQIAAGYPPVMPTYTKQLDEGDVLKLVAYIKSLGSKPKGSEP